MTHTSTEPEPSDPPACPVLQCPWQPSEEGELEEHLYDAHSARQLASTLASSTAALDAQAAMASGLLNELTERRNQALTEGAELIQAWHDRLPSEHECCDGNAASLLLAARTTQEG